VILISLSIIFSVISTWITLTRISPLTGFLGASQGIVNVTVNGTLSFTINPQSVNFSRLNPNDNDNTTDLNPLPFNVTNDGNSLLNISLSSAQLFQSAALGTFYFQVGCGNTTVEGNCSSRSNTTAPSQFTNVLSNSFVVIPYLDFEDSNDTNYIHVNVGIPAGEPAGLREAILTFTGVVT